MFNLNNLLPSKIKANNDSRKRFRISAFQVQSLEDVFKNNPRPCKEIQEEVAAQLNLPYRTVTIWFQNRRAKAKLIGEPIADHVFQWKPPVVATKSPLTNSFSVKNTDNESVKQDPSQEMTDSNDMQCKDLDASPDQDTNTSNQSLMASNFTNQNSLGQQSSFNSQLQNATNGWVPDPSFNNTEWIQRQQSLARNSMDSASFMSDFTNYEGCNFQMDFDSFLASQNNMDAQVNMSNPAMLTSPEGFNPQQIMAYPAGIFPPSLSHSVLSLSTQGTGSSGFYNDVCSNSSVNAVQGGFYAHPNGISVQSLPQFPGNGNMAQSMAMANSLGLQHPTQSAPELAFRNNMSNQIQPTPQARNAVKVKMEQERNNAMFFSMRS